MYLIKVRQNFKSPEGRVEAFKVLVKELQLHSLYWWCISSLD